VDRVLLGVGPCLQVSDEAEMLCDGWHVDLFFEADDVRVEAFLLLDCLLDEGLAISCQRPSIASHIAEQRLVGIQKHLVLAQIDGLGRHCISSDERANHNAKAILGSNALVQAFVYAASRRPALGLIELLLILMVLILFVLLSLRLVIRVLGILIRLRVR